MRDVKTVHLYEDMQPERKAEIYTHFVDGKLVRTLSIAMYSSEPEMDWQIKLSADQATLLAQRILQTFANLEGDQDSLTDE